MPSKSKTQPLTPPLTHTIVEMPNVQPCLAQLPIQSSLLASLFGRDRSPYSDSLKPYLTRQQFDAQVGRLNLIYMPVLCAKIAVLFAGIVLALLASISIFVHFYLAGAFILSGFVFLMVSLIIIAALICNCGFLGINSWYRSVAISRLITHCNSIEGKYNGLRCRVQMEGYFFKKKPVINFYGPPQDGMAQPIHYVIHPRVSQTLAAKTANNQFTIIATGLTVGQTSDVNVAAPPAVATVLATPMPTATTTPTVTETATLTGTRPPPNSDVTTTVTVTTHTAPRGCY